MDTANGMSQGQDTSSLPVSNPATQQSSTPVTADEKIFRQAEVNDIVKRAKYGAVEDFKRLQSEQPQYFNQKYGENIAVSQPQSNQHQGLREDDIRKIASEEAQRIREHSQQEARQKSEADQVQRIVQNFYSKINQGKDKYQDFEKTVGDMDLSRFPNVVQILADHVENSHDILYELGKDRSKLAVLENLATLSPRDAIVQAQRLSQSLRDNENATNTKTPNEPLSQLRPTNTGTGSNKTLSWSDLKSKYRG